MVCGRNVLWPNRSLDEMSLKHPDHLYHIFTYMQGFQSGPVPGTFTRLRSCIVPAEITEPPKISGGQNHKYDGR
jgi:hypothetical protein